MKKAISSHFFIFFYSFLTWIAVVSPALSSNRAQGRKVGFSVELIHRDSPKSPFYNPSSSRFDRLRDAYERSFSRADSFKQKHAVATYHSRLSQPTSDGEYLMKVSIGTPPVEIVAIADTGSDITWTQCQPCMECYSQTNFPFFYPNKSSSYKQLSCKSASCRQLGSHRSCNGSKCGYSITYRDGDYSNGDLATEIFTFTSISGRAIPFPSVAFGCGYKNKGSFSTESAPSGLIGLGGGDLSIVKQLDPAMFSYCLLPLGDESKHITSKINFGSNSEISRNVKAVTTPLIMKLNQSHYYLSLEKISVGNKTLPFDEIIKGKGSSASGNIIIDSGTTLTFVPMKFYEDLKSTVRERVKAKPIEDESKLCYNSSDHDIEFPKFVLHFTDADVELPPSNIFVPEDQSKSCLTVSPLGNNDPYDITPILGNIWQRNFLIEYNLEAWKLSFLPTDCTKQL